jgi:acyl-CoA thioester hydrolase
MAKAIPQAPTNAYRMEYRVPYSETDAMARVYYANYLIWLERGRTEMLREMGYAYRDLEEMGVFLPVRECNVRYLGFAQYDDMIEIVTWVSSISRARIEFTTLAYKKDTEHPITLGVVELACVGKNGKPQKFPEEIRNAFEGFSSSVE